MPIHGGGTGYVSLGDYLGANQQTLAGNYAGLQQQGNQDVAAAQGPAGQAQTEAAFAAQQFGKGIGSENALAGTYGNGPGGQFDAALQWAQNGQGLKSLSDYLGQQQPKPITPPGPPPPPPPPPDPTPTGGPGLVGPAGSPLPGPGGSAGGRPHYIPDDPGAKPPPLNPWKPGLGYGGGGRRGGNP